MKSLAPDLPMPEMRFQPTRWSLVRRAVTGGEPLGEWLGLYWYPLYAWARGRGFSPEDAADGVQGFLEKLCSRDLLSQADETRGRLRSWLLTSFGHYLADGHRRHQREKRGGGATHISVDWACVEAICQGDLAIAVTPDAVYTRTWALTLMEEALEKVARHYEVTGREPLFTALLPALEHPLPENTYEEVAAGLGMTGSALRQASVRLRQRYRRTLLEVAGARLGISSEEQLAEELRTLLGGSGT